MFIAHHAIDNVNACGFQSSVNEAMEALLQTASKGTTETSRNITTRVIERDTSGEIYYFLEDSRGFRTRQSRKNGRQSHQIGRQLGR
ncbi:hypothetical protein TNCV_2407291 [Trichonephila clavipes]|nr:hypothetical protein TNCV_2407291 [Trichonephila clavipes]